MNLTKYSNLTDDELITEALVILTNEDDLGLELLSRLMDMKDELDRWKADYEDELREIERHYDEKYDRLFNKYVDLNERVKALDAGDVEGVPV